MNFNCTFIIEKINERYINPSDIGKIAILTLKEDQAFHVKRRSHSEPIKKTMSKTRREHLTKMMFWLDKNWEAAWINVSNQAKPDKLLAIFQMQVVLQPLRPCTLTQERGNTVNTNVKMEFFTPHATKNTNMPDFRYMSACPLKFFTERRHAFRLGLWNYNLPCCDSLGTPLKEYLLTVINNEQTSIPSSIEPEGLPYVPTLDHHQKVVSLTRWMETYLTEQFPQERTIFKVLRTYCRAAWMTTFFFDLHKLYETKDGTNLPPIIALYIVCNASIVHRKDLQYILTLLRQAASNQLSSEEVESLLTLVRDIIMCFTLCTREGKYRDDLSLGEIVEDQPFSFEAREGDNVFDEDDCEGHNQQGCVHIKGLFQHIAKDFQKNDLQNVRAHVHSTRSCCLNVSDDEIEILLMIAVQLGLLFETKILDALLCVGEANFACFNEVLDANKKAPKPEGHSFGVLLFKDLSSNRIRGARILETTGWENRSLRPIDHTSYKREIRKSLQTLVSHNRINHILPQTIITEEIEDSLYLRVFSGDDCIFFTLKDEALSYGAVPSHIAKYARIYSGETKEEVLAWGNPVVLMVTPEQFLTSLTCADSPWGYRVGSSGKAQEYLEIKKKYPSFHKCLMPPQITEDQFLSKIKRNWGKINSDKLQMAKSSASDTVDRSFSFSCKVDPSSREYSPEITQFIRNIARMATVREHDFMQSKIISITPHN